MEEELLSISPIDGRYKNETDKVRNYFSEYSLIKNRVIVEIEWLKKLFSIEELELKITEEELKILDKIAKEFDINAAKRVKEIEQTTKHDVKAVEYYIDEKQDSKKDTNGKHFYGHISVYGETYRDAVLCCSVMFETYESDLSKEELEALMLAAANSIKFTDWDENALLNDDGSIISYQHHCTVPAKMTIAGAECEAKLETQGSDPLVYTNVIEDSSLFRISMDPFLLVGSSFENAKEKDKYTPATVNGCDALYAFDANSATGEFMIKISDDHIEKVVISVPSMANGSMSMDGKSFFDVRKEIAADPEAAKAKYNEFANDFVKAWIPDAE